MKKYDVNLEDIEDSHTLGGSGEVTSGEGRREGERV